MGDCRGPVPATVGGRFKLVGRAAFLAFWYSPQALQMVSPCGDLRHRGVRVVPQLLRFVRNKRWHEHGKIRLTCKPGPCSLARSRLVFCPDSKGFPPCIAWGLEARVKQRRRALMSARARRRIRFVLDPRGGRVGAPKAVSVRPRPSSPSASMAARSAEEQGHFPRERAVPGAGKTRTRPFFFSFSGATLDGLASSEIHKR